MAYSPNKAWKQMRLNHLRVYPECRACGTLDNPHVHHVLYRGQRGKSELPGDLMTLCTRHHSELHALVKETIPPLAVQLAFVERVQRRVMEEALGHYSTIG